MMSIGSVSSVSVGGCEETMWTEGDGEGAMMVRMLIAYMWL
jgi:hypothetical protein